MGRKIKLVSDPSLAKSHDAGAKVMAVQPSLHSQLGLIHIGQPIYWLIHLRIAEKAFRRLHQYENKLLAIPISQSNARFLNDISLVEKIYRAGFELSSDTYLACNHLSLQILSTVYMPHDQVTYQSTEKLGLPERIKHIFDRVLNYAQGVNSPGYGALFGDIEKMRHSFNHPIQERIYNAHEGQWDSVPLAWVVSGKYKDQYKQARDFLLELNQAWEGIKSQYEQPVTLLNVTRGIRSGHSYKKPKA